MDNISSKAGYAALIGRPNSGKSTLVNSILGTKLSIVTNKPQTTRKRTLGIYSGSKLQIVFLDTPGIVKPKYELHKTMLGYIGESIESADALVFIADVAEIIKVDDYLDLEYLRKLKTRGKPIILVLNKIDLLKNVKEILPIIAKYDKLKIFDEFIAISALKNTSVPELIKVLEKYMPENEFFYDPELISTQPEKFFVSEIIREYIFKAYKEEIPYSSEVNISEFKEREAGKWYIAADIIVERQSQKGIIIGAGGKSLKKIGELARAEIEDLLQEEVYLKLFVKVREKWRNDKNLLKSFGY